MCQKCDLIEKFDTGEAMPLKGPRYHSETPLENADIDKSSDRAKGRKEDNTPRNNVS